MSNEIAQFIDGIPLQDKKIINFEEASEKVSVAKELGKRMYYAGLFYASSIEKPQLSGKKVDFHEELMKYVEMVKITDYPKIALRTFLNKMNDAIIGSEKGTNHLNQNHLRVAMSEVWQKFSSLPLPAPFLKKSSIIC